MPSLGSLASEALSGITSYPHRLLLPSIAISLIILSFNLLGDGLRDAFDPKLKIKETKLMSNTNNMSYANNANNILLDIKNLKVSFFTPAGEVKAINDVSIQMEEVMYSVL